MFNMKGLLVFGILIVVVNCTFEQEWLEFKKYYGKTYKSILDEKLRYEIFKSNLIMITNHNARYQRGAESWFMGINKFIDLTDKEFADQYLTLQPNESFHSANIFVLPSNITVPDSIDWREKGAVLSVKDQGTCGSCWAFSAVGSLEGQNAVKHNTKIDLSPQELVDCGVLYRNNGCKGGWMSFAFQYIQDNGLATLADYPYTAHTDKCRGHFNSGHIKLVGYTEIPTTETDLKEAVGTVGPVSVSIDALSIKQYAGGIFNNKQCGTYLNHGVLAVGYGSEMEIDFWIVKNSWGTDWGEKGYIRMTRNQDNQCGIALRASYPNIE